MPDPRPRFVDRLRGARRRWRALVFRTAADRETSRELAFHLEMETENNIRRGMDPVAARRAALIAFGGVGRFSEDVRDVRNIGWLEDLAQDLRHAARGFRRAPGFAAAAVIALSLGIGATTAVFSVVDAVVIAPLPFAEPHRLIRVWENNPSQHTGRSPVSPGTFVDLRERSHTIESIALLGVRTMLLSDGGGESWEARTAAVSPAFFDMLGMRPVAGRTFPPEDGRSKWDGSFDQVVISHRIWQQRFGGNPDVVGRTIRMEHQWTYTIVGVMPAGFAFPENAEVWVPLVYPPAVSATERQYRYYGAIARLEPGVTFEQAAQDAAAISSHLAAEHPASNAGWTVQMAPLDRALLGNTRPTLLVLLGLSACVLLIACGNVATLAVARATARGHETAVRVALGAGTRRLLRQWMAEGVLLAVLGGAGGLAIAYYVGRLLLAIAPADIPRLDRVAFGWPVLAFALLAIVATGLLVGFVPALRSRHSNPLGAMRSRTVAAGASRGTRDWLVGVQVALALVLTVASALLLRSFERLRATDLGFRRHDILSVEVRIPGGRFPGPNRWSARLEYYDRLIADLGTLPGIRSVAGTTSIPLTGELGSGSMWRTDAPGARGRQPPTSAADQWRAAIQIVTPRYFETMGIPIVRGRSFDAGDRFVRQADADEAREPGVAIVNEAMARTFWPDGTPLGTTIFLFDDKSFALYRTVVGVVRDIRAEAVDAVAVPTVFLPLAQHPGRGISLVLRSELPPAELVGPVTDRLRAFDAAITGTGVRPLTAVVGGALSRPRFTAMLVTSFAVLALVIAAVGVFGVVAYLVARRTQEIGIRIALGAGSGSVLWLVLREGLRPVLLGTLAGCLGAVAVARGMRVMLYGLAPLDGVSFAASAAILVAASAVAAVRPALRAARVDPLRSLRGD